MAKRPSKHLRAPRPLGSGHASSATKADGTWVMRTVSGSAATKSYTCPGCHRPIPPGTPHVVAWPSSPTSWNPGARAVDERRHWHTGCWNRKH